MIHRGLFLPHGRRCQNLVLSWADGVDPPRTLTPSKVATFTNCPLAFQFSVIEHRPEPPSPHAVKGTLVHTALERLFWNHQGAGRTEAVAADELERAWVDLQSDPEFVEWPSRRTRRPPSWPTPGSSWPTTSGWRTPPRCGRSAWSSGSRSSRTACGSAASSTGSIWRPMAP